MSSLRSVMRFWAAVDLAVTLLMAVPPWALWFVDVLFRINGLLGERDAPGPVDPVYLTFMFLAGALGVVWALARLWLVLPRLALIDALARVWVAILLAYCVVVYQAPVALLAFVVTEVAGALHQGFALFRSSVR